jgi:hypothetical protein
MLMWLTWHFWDPFMPSSTRSATVKDHEEESWEEISTTIASETTAPPTGGSSITAPPKPSTITIPNDNYTSSLLKKYIYIE